MLHAVNLSSIPMSVLTKTNSNKVHTAHTPSSQSSAPVAARATLSELVFVRSGCAHVVDAVSTNPVLCVCSEHALIARAAQE